MTIPELTWTCTTCHEPNDIARKHCITIGCKGFKPIQPQPTPNQLIDGELPYDDAVTFIKKSRGRAIFIHAQQFAPNKIQNEPRVPGHTSGFEVQGSVETSRREALRYLGHAYGTRVREICNVRIAFTKRCLLIG
jgi:hypothetical protein